MQIVISPTGIVRCLYDEALDLRELGVLVIERGSHVEPTPDGHWLADLSQVDGPLLGPYPHRSQALAAEQAWLEAHRLSEE